MRILGLAAKDKAMTQSFMDGVDFHKDTASLVFGKDIEDVTRDERQKSKAISFGLVYGKGTGSLASDMDVSYKEAEEVVNKYYETKPDVKEFIEGTKQFLRNNGYVDTLQGHRRQLQGIFGDKRTQAEALRQSVNTVIQGSGAFLTNTSTILITEYLRKNNKKSKMVATVHDSVVIDVHPDEVREITSVVKHIMENLPIPMLKIAWEDKLINYPIVADVELGSTYGDIYTYDPEEFHSFKTVKGFTEYKKLEAYVGDSLDYSYITEEEYEHLIKQVEDRKPYYQEMGG